MHRRISNYSKPRILNAYFHDPQNQYCVSCFHHQLWVVHWVFYKNKRNLHHKVIEGLSSIWKLIFFYMYATALITNQRIAYNFCFFAFCLIVLTISIAIFWCSFVCECKSRPSTVSQSTLHIRHHPMLEVFLLLKLSNDLISP